ncbi:serine/threonine protein kinase [Nannizzia gypsea CBS 118893]|uniref:Serine/threonine protein kinase n=1 Tax=Arthroderma gypseum (strain ATCC MYA-4604 / CBS 118893) TaxID=535722 RepID=E4UQ10_ARTGP|nr:serine/threonine protein kinase [Nannizzia gypsea CBS 118893]EFQ99144.1 serine/threonine protein kinase [Nannizzia gypsea CBS 118893]
MSVLRHGSAFLQRRLTKLYTDTKSSCESVTTAARPNDDPELVSLNRHFRTQKDRLLAWGLDWSDASAAQPNDIDEALAEAGFSDVVASVMSSIQKLLNEAERLQHPNPAAISSDGIGSKAADGSYTTSTPGGVKTTWTEAEISRSKVLLEELTSHIDTLYDLSASRRDISMGISSSNPQSEKYAHHRGLSKQSKEAKEALRPKLPTSKSAPSKTTHHHEIASTKATHDMPAGSPFINMHIDHTMTLGHAVFQQQQQQQPFHTQPNEEFFLDRNALVLSKERVSHATTPPPYEAVAASTSSRAMGYINRDAVPSCIARSCTSASVPVMVEFLPILMEAQQSLAQPLRERLKSIAQTLNRLIDNSRVSHLGLLRFIGYYIDMTYSRYGFVYHTPIDNFPFLKQPSDTIQPRSLVSLLHNGDDKQEGPIPNLEDRLALAYNLLLSVLHLRSQNLVHGSINSNNIMIFPGVHLSNTGSISNGSLDYRRPYFTSFSQFDSDDKNAPLEPLSSSMYRHPEDRRAYGDKSAWAYDLYSLGLVLLEIGLWTPIGRLWKLKYNNSMFKSRIENVYVKKLAAKCGGAYMQVVQLCLDAPNFHLLPEPMVDLGLRIPQTYHYPWHDPGQSNDWNTFSKDFVYTIGKILWRCCGIDFFSPPPASDLEDSLPPPLGLGPESSSVQQIPQNEGDMYFMEPTVSIDVPYDISANPDMKNIGEMCEGNEKKARKRSMKKWSNVEIPDEHLQAWNKALMPKLSKLLQKILKDSPESCSATLLVAGETADTAKTTICVTCTNVRKVRAALKKYFEYDRENWNLIVIRGDIKRSKVPRKKRRKPKLNQGIIAPETSKSDFNSYYQSKPLCGASIGAFRYDEHLPPVSYGGAIIVDDVPYGMTVHHMLDTPCDDDDDYEDDYDYGDEDYPPRSAANYPFGPERTDRETSFTWGEANIHEDGYPLEFSDDEDGDDDQSIAHSLDETFDDHWLSDSYSSDEGDDYGGIDDDDDTASIGDTVGVDPDQEPRIMVTQPALDDIHEDFFPNPEDRDDEHLASHSLGYVHASSGVRRWTKDGIKHEVDWALIKVDLNRMEAKNLVPVSSLQPSTSRLNRRQPYNGNNGARSFRTLTKIAKFDDLGGQNVQCCGRTSGFQSGKISKALTLVKMYGRQSFSTSFSVDGNFGVPGDSGAWVFNDKGQVCGHVLAWSEKSRSAYIAPMEILLNDIARTLCAFSVKLPDGDEEICYRDSSPPPPLRGIPPPMLSVHATQPLSSPAPVMAERLPVDLQKLTLDLEEPPRNNSRIGSVKKKDVSGTYRARSPLMPHACMERQIA